MEDNYFDKKLKKILESPPDFKLDQSALAAMGHRLDDLHIKEKSRRRALAGWLLLFLPLFAGGFYFFSDYQTLNKQVELLTVKLENIEKDTLHNKIITYQYDTVYTVVYKEKIIEREIIKQKGSNNNLQPPYGLPFKYLKSFPNNNVFSHWGLDATGPELLAGSPNSSFFSLVKRTGMKRKKKNR